MKTAIVLEGGASRALFGVGVTDVLLQNNIYADLVVGSSAGIANGISYVSHQCGRAREIALKYTADKRYMGLKHLLNRENRSLYNIQFVFREIPEHIVPLDYDTLKRTQCKSYACVTEIETAEAQYLPIIPCSDSWKSFVATCALPIMFSPVEIDGKLYMDGGIVQSVPVDFAIEQGCDRVICVLTRERGYKKKEHDFSLAAAAWLYRNYPEFSKVLKKRNVLYNRMRDHLYDLEKDGKIMIIAPTDTHGFSRTEKDPKRLDAIWKQGADIASENIDAIREYFGK